MHLAADAVGPAGFGPGSLGAVLLHELGHAAGLDHTADPGEQMFPMVQPDRPAGWGPGGRPGLALLGGPCVSELTGEMRLLDGPPPGIGVTRVVDGQEDRQWRSGRDQTIPFRGLYTRSERSVLVVRSRRRRQIGAE